MTGESDKDVLEVGLKVPEKITDEEDILQST
jgi:hypothetical protein